MENDVIPPSHNKTNQIHCLSFGRVLIHAQENLIHFFMATFSTKDVITVTGVT